MRWAGTGRVGRPHGPRSGRPSPRPDRPPPPRAGSGPWRSAERAPPGLVHPPEPQRSSRGWCLFLAQRAWSPRRSARLPKGWSHPRSSLQFRPERGTAARAALLRDRRSEWLRPRAGPGHRRYGRRQAGCPASPPGQAGHRWGPACVRPRPTHGCASGRGGRLAGPGIPYRQSGPVPGSHHPSPRRRGKRPGRKTQQEGPAHPPDPASGHHSPEPDRGCHRPPRPGRRGHPARRRPGLRQTGPAHDGWGGQKRRERRGS